MILSRTLIIVISEEVLEGYLVSGTSVQRHTVVPLEESEGGIEFDFRVLDQALGDVITSLGVSSGMLTRVVMSPRVGSCQVRFSQRGDFAAARAGELAALHSCTTEDSSELETRTWVCDLGSGDGRAFVSGAMRDTDLQSISDFIERKGLRFGGVLPLKMWECRLALRDSTLSESDEMICRISPECTVLVVKSEGKADVVRVVDFGVQSIAKVYARAATQHDTPLSQSELWTKLMTYGVSRAARDADDQVVRDALPLLAPVIQRINIELKQTLRYRVSEGTKINRVAFSGLGGRIPGLCDAISGHLELEQAGATTEDPPVADGLSVQRHEFNHSTIPLLKNANPFFPRTLERRRAIRRLSSITVQGAMIALVMVAGEWLASTIALEDATTTKQALVQEVELLRQSVDSDAMLRRERAEVMDSVLALDQSVPHAPHWPAAARLVLDCDPLQVESVTISRADQEVTAVFSGWLPATDGEGTLEEILDRWRASGPIDHVEPSSIVRTLGPDGREVLRLRIDITLKRFPVWVRQPQLAGVFEGGAS